MSRNVSRDMKWWGQWLGYGRDRRRWTNQQLKVVMKIMSMRSRPPGRRDFKP